MEGNYDYFYTPIWHVILIHNYMKTKHPNPLVLGALLSLLSFTHFINAQTPSWQLWAQGLQQGAYPHLSVAPNHDIFYSLIGAPPPMGIVSRANTQQSFGNFVNLPPIPVPTTLQNNVMFVVANNENEPIAGVYRTNLTDHWVYRLDNNTQQWEPSNSDGIPTLGGHCAVRSKDGTIWVGVRWTNIYKSTDGGHNFTQIREDSSIAAAYPCYFPTWLGSDISGAIFSINVDGNGRVYAGTETAGIIYSDDQGLSWHPADYHPCQDLNPFLKDSTSAMKPLGYGGNAAGIGFTKDNNLVWNGPNMWFFNWPNTLGYADMTNHTTMPVNGIPQYLVTTGQQVTRIVTASNGQMFLYSGGAANAQGIGIYTSMDGINWTLFNTGITGALDNQSQGSLAVDSNLVFFASHDGKVWRYDVSEHSSGIQELVSPFSVLVTPNPAHSSISITVNLHEASNLTFSLYDFAGKEVYRQQTDNISEGDHVEIIHLNGIPTGMYFLKIGNGEHLAVQKLLYLPE